MPKKAAPTKTKAKAKQVAAVAPADDLATLYDSLSNVAPVKSAAETKKSAPRYSCDEDPEMNQALDLWAASSLSSKLLKAQNDADAAILKPLGLRRWLREWFKTHIRPDNPVLFTSQASAMFQVKSKIKVVCPKDSTVDEQLKLLGIAPPKCKELASIVKSKQSLAIKPFDKLLEESDKTRVAALALLKVIKEHLAPEYQEIVLERKPTLVVDGEELFAKIAIICTDADEAEKVFQVLAPELALSSAQHTDVMGVTQQRLNKAAEQMTK